MTSEPVTDVIIIGGGHAGLAAAQTLYRHGHSAIILDSGASRSRTAWKYTGDSESPLRLVAGSEGGSAAELRKTNRTELQRNAGDLIKFVDNVEVVSITRIKIEGQDDGGFEAVDQKEGRWRGRKLLLAMGATDGMLDIKGYKECYPRRIFHCLFTYGPEALGSARAGLITRSALASPMHAVMLGADTLKIAERLVFLTDGQPALEPEIRAMTQKIQPDIAPLVSFEHRRIAQLQIVEPTAANGNGTDHTASNGETDSEAIDVVFDSDSPSSTDTSSTRFDFLVHQPATTSSCSNLLRELGLEVNERGDIPTVNPFGGTACPGVFAAGDCASLFKIVPAAMFTGAAAGAGLARALGTTVVRERRGLQKA